MIKGRVPIYHATYVPMRIGIDATVRMGFIDSIWFGKEGAHTHFFGMIPIQSIPITMQEYGVQDLFTRWEIPWTSCRKFLTLTQPASMCCLSFCFQKPSQILCKNLWNNSDSFLLSTVWDHFSVKAYRAYADSHLNQLIRGTQFDQSVLLA